VVKFVQFQTIIRSKGTFMNEYHQDTLLARVVAVRNNNIITT